LRGLFNDTQVAADQTSPEGRVIGIDIIPAQPPRGVSTIQGNFLSPAVQNEVKEFLRDSGRAMLNTNPQPAFENIVAGLRDPGNESDFTDSLTLQTNVEPQASTSAGQPSEEGHRGESEHYSAEMRLVDVVLSDMSAPWEMTDGFWKRSLSDPHYRMMNTSGMSFRDHAGSMV
jgi:21S rRNA (uridine2791-2'-O)-methyltransferase